MAVGNPITAIKESIAKHLAKARLGNDIEIGIASMTALDKSYFGGQSRQYRRKAYEFGEAAIREYIKLLQSRIEDGDA